MAKSTSIPERVFINGRIYTLNPLQPWAEAHAVCGDKILRIGSSADIKALASGGAELIDLDGRMVLPGINDVHVHPLIGGRTALYETTFLPTLSLEEVLEVIHAAAQSEARGVDYRRVVGQQFHNCVVQPRDFARSRRGE
jgi:predicted amidohydrolase YtcJ